MSKHHMLADVVNIVGIQDIVFVVNIIGIQDIVFEEADR